MVRRIFNGFEYPAPHEYEAICEDWTQWKGEPLRGIDDIARRLEADELEVVTAFDLLKGMAASMSLEDIRETQSALQNRRAVYNVAHDALVDEVMDRAAYRDQGFSRT